MANGTQQSMYKLILLDYNMDGIDGLQAAGQMRKHFDEFL